MKLGKRAKKTLRNLPAAPEPMPMPGSGPVASKDYIPEISDPEFAFPANMPSKCPKIEDVPREFHHGGDAGGWGQIMQSWLFGLLNPRMAFIPHEGVDPQKAGRFLSAALRCYAFKVEDKIAITSYLASLWFKETSEAEPTPE